MSKLSKEDAQFIIDKAKEYIINTPERHAQQEMLAHAYYLAVLALQEKQARKPQVQHTVLNSKRSVNTR